MITCMSCDRIWDNGIRRPPQPAAYWWTGPNGYAHPICESCCGWWLLNAVEDDWLAPQRVESIAARP